MFIRESTKTIEGKKYVQHQLVKSVRTPRGPRNKLILNLGKIDIPKEDWKRLTNAIEAAIKKQPMLIEEEDSNENFQILGKHYAALISRNELNKNQKPCFEGATGTSEDFPENSTTVSTSPETSSTASTSSTSSTKTLEASNEADYASIDINSIEYFDAKTVGGEQVVLSQLREYGFGKFLETKGFTAEQIKIAEAQIISRAVHPASEKETARWLNENSATNELIGLDKRMYDNALHRVAHSLLAHKEAIEDQLAKKAKEHFLLQEKIILYDLTNTFFLGSKRSSQIAKVGRSKEKRNDRPLVSLALRVDERGFPKGSEILPGNVGEPETLKKVLDTIKESEPLLVSEKTIVMDAGIASDQNLKLIQSYGFHYLAVSRKRTFPPSFWKDAKQQEIPRPSDKKNPLKVKLVKTETEAFLLCESPSKKAKGNAILEARQTKFEAQILDINAGLQKPKCIKQYDQVLQKIGRLKEKYKVGSLYDIKIEKVEKMVKKTSKKAPEKAGEKQSELETQTPKSKTNQQYQTVVTSIKLEKNSEGKAKKQALGQYVIRTDRLDLDQTEISQLHRSLTTVEASFRSMKSELGLRPNYHQSDENMKAHIFITILAYHMIAAINQKLEKANLFHQWNTYRNILSNHTRISSHMRTQDNHIIHLRTTTIANLEQIQIYNALNIKHDPLGRRKIKCPIPPQKENSKILCSDEKNKQN